METKFSDFVSIGHDYLDQHLFIDDLTQTIRMKSKFIDQLFDTIKTDTFTNELIEKYDDIGTNLFRRYSLNVGMPGEQNMFKIETFLEAKGSLHGFHIATSKKILVQWEYSSLILRTL